MTGLRKRHAIYQVFRHLVESGVAPEEVAKHCGPRANRALVSAEGKVTGDDFYRLAKEARAAEGRNFDSKRFFSDDDELLHFRGRTYAFSSQWGGTDWEQAMINLRDAFPDQGIAFLPSE